MRLLLDTHALLWWLADDPRLTEPARSIIGDGRTRVAVSAVTVWEIAIKRALGKLQVPDDLIKQVGASGFLSLPVTLQHGWAAGKLPEHHDDPFDRMLIAQARAERLVIATSDRRFGDYDVELASL